MRWLMGRIAFERLPISCKIFSSNILDMLENRRNCIRHATWNLLKRNSKIIANWSSCRLQFSNSLSSIIGRNKVLQDCLGAIPSNLIYYFYCQTRLRANKRLGYLSAVITQLTNGEHRRLQCVLSCFYCLGFPRFLPRLDKNLNVVQEGSVTVSKMLLTC